MGGEAGAFELDRGVIDSKFAGKNFAHLRQNFFALFHVHVGDAYMARQRVEVGAKRPDVDVVNFLDAFDAKQRACDCFEFDVPWQAFEQDVGAFAQNPDP